MLQRKISRLVLTTDKSNIEQRVTSVGWLSNCCVLFENTSPVTLYQVIKQRQTLNTNFMRNSRLLR